MEQQKEIVDPRVIEQFTELYTSNFDSIRYYVYKIVNDSGVAEDFTQESFIRLWEHKIIQAHSSNPGWEKICRAWLYTTAVNQCRNWVNSEKIRKEKREKMEEPIGNLEGELVKFFLYKELYEAIETLPKECKKTFNLFLSGYDSGQAEKIGVSKSTVKSQKARGVPMIRDFFAGKRRPNKMSIDETTGLNRFDPDYKINKAALLKEEEIKVKPSTGLGKKVLEMRSKGFSFRQISEQINISSSYARTLFCRFRHLQTAQ